MNKIPTLFKRDFNNRGRITKEYTVKLDGMEGVVATEKLDGTNVRLTVRSGKLVRLEKRRNPTKREKAQGIITPWYVDADEYDSQDKYIWEAARNTDLKDVFDGEWSGEAIGPKIQGNPLNLTEHTVFLFSEKKILRSVVFEDAPVTYDGLKEWLPKQKSKFGNDCGIEGIVWWVQDVNYQWMPLTKIKLKDFKV